jgi:hypothetical protein
MMAARAVTGAINLINLNSSAAAASAAAHFLTILCKASQDATFLVLTAKYCRNLGVLNEKSNMISVMKQKGNGIANNHSAIVIECS